MINIPYLTAYKTHRCIRRSPISTGQIKKKILVKISTNIKRDKINILNIIHGNTFNLQDSLLIEKTMEHAGDNYTNCNWCVWNRK